VDILNELSELIQQGKMQEIAEKTEKALEQGLSPVDILDNGLIKGMEVVGDKFKKNEIFVPEMLIAARAMNKALETLEPRMVKGDIKTKGTIVIGTVEGDLHDIGKNLVGIMFKGAGYKVVDLGVNVSAAQFIDGIKEHKAEFAGLSALLTTTMGNMKSTIVAIKEAGLDTLVLVGGAPVSEGYAEEMKADGFADDAGSALDVAKSLLA
jgi:5-methyltetrahydrofolate--homocysteine methyltransferase